MSNLSKKVSFVTAIYCPEKIGQEGSPTVLYHGNCIIHSSEADRYMQAMEMAEENFKCLQAVDTDLIDIDLPEGEFNVDAVELGNAKLETIEFKS